MLSSHTQRAARGVHEEPIPSIHPPVQTPASGTKTGQVKQPQAECLDRREVTKDHSGLGSEFSFTTSSQLPNYGSARGRRMKVLKRAVCAPSLQPKSLCCYPNPVCSPSALRSGSVK